MAARWTSAASFDHVLTDNDFEIRWKVVESRIRFAPVTTRWLKVTQKGKKSGLWWSIHELNLYGRRAGDER